MEKSQIKGMVFAALFAALTGAVAWFKIPLPFTPVPITLQTLMVLLSGAMLGAYYGALSMIIYLILGAIGLPVFAGGSSGVPALLGPTGGYLFSYPVAAFVVGLFTAKSSGKVIKKYSLGSVIEETSLIVLFTIVSGIIISLFVALYSAIPMKNKIDLKLSLVALVQNFNFKSAKIVLLLLVVFFVLGYLLKKYIGKSKFISFLKYGSYIAIVLFVIIVFLDASLKIGILKLWDKSTNSYVPMVSLLTEQQRTILIAVSLAVALLLLFLIYYAKKSKMFSADDILAMFVGTIIIYFMGVLQARFVVQPQLPWSALLVGWVLPFILGDTIKLIIAAYIAKNVDAEKYMK